MGKDMTPRSAASPFHCTACGAKPAAAQTTMFDEHPPARRMFWCERCRMWRPV